MSKVTFRYLNKEVLIAMLAFTFVLMVIIVTGRLSRYLTAAAHGNINPHILLWLIWYRLPDFFQLILPMGLFLGVLLGFGRLYVDNEMTVLLACGLSVQQIVMKLLGVVLVVTVVVAALSLWITPQSNDKLETLWHAQNDTTMELEAIVPGRFQSQANNTRVAYTETLSADKQQLGNVFIAQRNRVSKKSASKDDSDQTLMIIVAESATQKINQDTDERFLILKNGYRYDGRPGQLDYREMNFSTYGVKITNDEEANAIPRQAVKTTRELWQSTDAEDRAELQWRLSMPLLVPIATLLAIALSQVKPRQGRFVKLVPALCIYLLYVLMLAGMQSVLKSQQLSFVLGMWWIHIVFLILALLLFRQDQLVRYWREFRSPISH